jgi:hypothetical protein
MKFLCLIRAAHLHEELAPAIAAQHLEKYREFAAGIRASGQLVGGNRLLPPATATTIRVRDGRVSTVDGPYAETKEQLGGYFLIEARDREAAIRVAARVPGAQLGSVEVRPVADDEATRRVLEA